MSDLDTLRRAGIKANCIVDANGVALNGTATLQQIFGRGMSALCQVNSVGVEPNTSTSAAALQSRGIKTFCQLNESGVDPITSDTAAAIADRGVLGLIAVDTSGVVQNGSKTLAQVASMGIACFAPVDETGTEFTLGGIILSANSVPENSANNTTVGTASIVVSVTGTPVWAITDASGTFKINSSTGVIQVLSNTLLDFETHTSFPVTISVSGTTPTIPSLALNLFVTNVIEAPVNSVAPAVTGSAKVGATVTSDTGTWTDMGAGTFAYQWQHTTTNISGKTSASYVVEAAYVGETLRCVVSATNTNSTVAANSNNTAAVTKNTISYSAVTSGTQGTPYTGATPTSTGGTSPVSYSVLSALPTGLSVDSSSGIISGTPTVAGTTSGLILRSTDANGITSDSSSFSITIASSGGGGSHTPPNLLLRDGTSYFLERNGSDRITLRVGVFVLLLHNGTDHLLLAHT